MLGGEAHVRWTSCAPPGCGTLGEACSPTTPSRGARQPRTCPCARSARTRRRPSRWPGPGCSSPPSPAPTARYDTARAFEQAGAEREILVVKNLSACRHRGDHRAAWKRPSASAQIVMLPGGFSGGDEPDGSGKFIATTFRNPRHRRGCHRAAGKPGRPDAGHLQRLPGADQAGPGALRQDHASSRRTTPP